MGQPISQFSANISCLIPSNFCENWIDANGGILTERDFQNQPE